MKFSKKLISLALFASFSGAALAAPQAQVCSPLEIIHSGGAGLSYNLKCEAGDWKLRYSGAIPSGDAAARVQYKLEAFGPAGEGFTQSRFISLPSPSRLGYALVREAVRLDDGNLALRDCEELGCTRYRIVESAKSAGKRLSPAAASVTVPPEMKRLQDEQANLTNQIAELRAQLIAERALAVREQDASVRAERERSTMELDSLRLQMAESLTAKEAEHLSLMEQAAAKFSAMEADLRNMLRINEAKLSETLAAQRQETSELLAQKQLELDQKQAQLADVQARLQEMELELNTLNAELGKLRTVNEALSQAASNQEGLPVAQREAYEFAIASLIAQHNEQITALTNALPEMNLKGIVEPLAPPSINPAEVPKLPPPPPLKDAPVKKQKKKNRR